MSSTLVHRGQDRINIHATNERAFRLSCRNGHLTVAQWLYSLGGINNHANRIYLLGISGKKIYLSRFYDKQILTWLQKLKN